MPTSSGTYKGVEDDSCFVYRWRAGAVDIAGVDGQVRGDGRPLSVRGVHVWESLGVGS